MPEVFYNLIKIKRDKQEKLCRGASSNKLEKESPVFHFLETHFANSSIGTNATYTESDKNGQRGYYLYERTLNGFLLIKRNFFSQGGALLKSEMVPVPKNIRI